MPNTIGHTRRRGTEIVYGVNTAGLLLHKPQLREPRLRVRDRAKPFRTSRIRNSKVIFTCLSRSCQSGSTSGVRLRISQGMGHERGAGGSPSTWRQHAAAAHSKVWYGSGRSGHAAQDGLGWSVRDFGAPGPRDGPLGKAGGRDACMWRQWMASSMHDSSACRRRRREQGVALVAYDSGGEAKMVLIFSVHWCIVSNFCC
jgi:hypothetical protein